MDDSTPNFELMTSSLTDALYDSVRKRIINGEFTPGEKLTEARISSEYSVARTTAKACLERLTGAGLLRRTAHRTAVVPVLDENEILDLFLAREAVESSAVARLAASRRVPAEAADAQKAIETAISEGVFEQQVDADIHFHSGLVTGVGSQRLSRMHELIMGEVHLTMGQFQAHKSAPSNGVGAEHAAILAAIEAGDPELAVTRLSTHLHAARDRLIIRVEQGIDAPSS